MRGRHVIDERTFREMHQRTAPAILAYLLRRVTIREDAADLLADVYLVAWRRREVIPSPPDDRPWLFGVARNVLRAHARGEAVRHATADELRRELREEGDTSPVVDARVDAVMVALDALPAADRELITLVVWDGLTAADAARAMGMSPGTARIRLHRARRRLRGMLDGRPDTAPRGARTALGG